jgi:aspartyl-tRNA(Asn)/glutamyl-tRNA(Gln) amidotransferase subunit A
MKSNILDLHNKIINGQNDIVQQALSIEKQNKYNQNIIVNENIQIPNEIDKNNLLSCIPYSLKALYSTKDLQTTGGSKIIEDYLPPFDSKVYEILKQNNAILISKSNQDELGMGGTGRSSAYGNIINPYDNNYIVGGSSGGSAVQVAMNILPFSIVTDTADSARSPASYLGICGFKPTYGAISRYGVVPYAPSLDTVGILAQYVADINIVASYLFQFDKNDYTSQKVKINQLPKKYENIKINAIKDIEMYLADDVKQIYLNSIDKLSKQYEIQYIEFPTKYLELISSVYLVISYCEAASIFSNYTGLTFGNAVIENGYEQSIKAFRQNNFSSMIKRKIVIGNTFLDQENYHDIFIKAKKIRNLIVQKFNSILDSCDCLIMPSHSMFAPKIDDLSNGSLIDEKK